MSPLDQQLEDLKQRFRGTEARSLPSGATLITIPALSIPDHWSKNTTSIRFIVPLGYPVAKPDCFWADQDLKLRSQTPIQAGTVNQIPETNEFGLWFSWHANQWNANSDNLITYVNIIKNRLKDPR
jgi:Prokaryotic E2 family E